MSLTVLASLWQGIVEGLSRVAKKYGVVLIGGSLIEHGERGYWNTAPVIGPDGGLIGTYRKTHILEDECYHESKYFLPGDGPRRPFEARAVQVDAGWVR
jgi:N-carbamoylputrescine amidase